MTGDDVLKNATGGDVAADDSRCRAGLYLRSRWSLSEHETL